MKTNNTRIKANDQLMKANVRIANARMERMADIVYPELSYRVMGVLFKVHRALGNQQQEKHYQRAIELGLKELDIHFEREKMIGILFAKEQVGKYFLDFFIDKKLILEVKAVPFFRDEYLKQILSYLDAVPAKLGIVANFRTPRLTYKRLINPRVKIL